MLGRLSRRQRRWIYILGGIVIGVALFLWLLPIGLRYGTVYWLEKQGMQAEIEDIDLNLFTGTLVITEAHGDNPDGGGFDIGHALVNLHYLPLFSKHIYPDRVELRDTRIDLRRNEAGAFWVAGLPIGGGESAEEAPPEEDGEPWGFGLDKVAIDSLTLRYLTPEFTREVTLSSTNASDVATWQPRTPIPLDAKASIGDATVQLAGNVQPFGESITGQLALSVDKLGLDVAAPLVRDAGIAELAGVLDTDLDIQLDYHASEGLKLGLGGDLSLAGAEIDLPAATLEHADIDWQGELDARLLHRDGPDSIESDGKLGLAALDLTMPDGPAIKQKSLAWEGTAGVTLDEATKVRTDGTLALEALDVGLSDGVNVQQKTADWQGQVQAELGKATAIEAEGELQLGNSDVTLPDVLDLALGRIDWQGRTEVRIPDSGPEVDAKGALTLGNADVALPANGAQIDLDELDWQGTASYAPGEPALVDSDGRLRLAGPEARMSETGLVASGDEIVWEGRVALDGDIEGMPENPDLALAVGGQLNAAALALDDTRRQRRLFQLSSLAVGGARVRGLQNVSVGSLNAGTAQALERAGDTVQTEKFPYVLRLSALDLDGLRLTDTQRLTVDTLEADSLGGYMLRHESGDFEFVEWLDQVATRATEEPAEQEPSEFTFALNRVGLKGDTQFVLADQTVAPDFALTVHHINLDIRNLDSAEPGKPSPLSLTAKVGRYGNIGVEGDIRPFADPMSLNLDGQIEALNLVPISGYVAAAIERRVSQGTLDAKLDFDVDQGAIDGNTDLQLSKFRLGSVVGSSGAVEQNLGLPLDRVLSLLRDGDGNINLSIPVGGNLANPSFSLRDVIQKAILKGVQTAVLSYYSPLGVLTVGKKLVDLATALRFDPVFFEPGSTELDSDDRAYLDDMTELLNKRPKAQFVICGHAVPKDRKALELPARNAEGANEEALSAATKRLLGVARERLSVVGDYLTEQGIDDNRLVLCDPTLGEDADARPRTTISF